MINSLLSVLCLLYTEGGWEWFNTKHKKRKVTLEEEGEKKAFVLKKKSENAVRIVFNKSFHRISRPLSKFYC